MAQPNPGEYEKMIREQGAIAADGLTGLASIAAAAGNDISLAQGHAELAAHSRLPLHPGKNATIDLQKGAKFLDAEND